MLLREVVEVSRLFIPFSFCFTILMVPFSALAQEEINSNPPVEHRKVSIADKIILPERKPNKLLLDTQNQIRDLSDSATKYISESPVNQVLWSTALLANSALVGNKALGAIQNMGDPQRGAAAKIINKGITVPRTVTEIPRVFSKEFIDFLEKRALGEHAQKAQKEALRMIFDRVKTKSVTETRAAINETLHKYFDDISTKENLRLTKVAPRHITFHPSLSQKGKLLEARIKAKHLTNVTRTLTLLPLGKLAAEAAIDATNGTLYNTEQQKD